MGAVVAAAAAAAPAAALPTAPLYAFPFAALQPSVFIGSRRSETAIRSGRPAACGSLCRTVCSAAAGDAGGGSAGSPAAPQQFSLLRITGDGNCLFRSLAQGAHAAEQEDAAAATGSSSQAPQLLPADQETAAAAELRAAICQELLSRRWEAACLPLQQRRMYAAGCSQVCKWRHHPSPGLPLSCAGRSCASSLTATTTPMWRACSSHTCGEVRLHIVDAF